MKNLQTCIICCLLLLACKKDKLDFGYNGQVRINGVPSSVQYLSGLQIQGGNLILQLGFQHYYESTNECLDYDYALIDTLAEIQIGQLPNKSLGWVAFSNVSCDVSSCVYEKLDTAYRGTFLKIHRLDTAAKRISYSFATKLAQTTGQACSSNRPDSVLVEGTVTNMSLLVQHIQ